MKREDNDTAVGVPHFHVTAFSMNFNEAEPREGRQDLPA